jgi:[protein-PII] uridylyltransferase
MKPVLANLLQLLWDSGLKVGHSFRTVGDCVTSALDDGHLRTALVNTRFLAGNRGYTTHWKTLWKRIGAAGRRRS